jgi:hypothetical protein
MMQRIIDESLQVRAIVVPVKRTLNLSRMYSVENEYLCYFDCWQPHKIIDSEFHAMISPLNVGSCMKCDTG